MSHFSREYHRPTVKSQKSGFVVVVVLLVVVVVASLQLGGLPL